MVNFRTTVNPRVKELKDAMKLTVRDMEAIATTLDSQFVKNMKRQFSTEGSSGGQRWQELSPAYKKWKQKKYPGRKILTRKGTMRKAFSVKGNKDHVKKHYLIPRATVELGARSLVAAYHSPGALHNKNLPVRDPIQLTRRQSKQYRKLIQGHLADKLKQVSRALQVGAAEMRALGFR